MGFLSCEIEHNMNGINNDSYLNRFLDILGLEKKKPSIEALHEIVRAFATHVPFENISKLYYLHTQGLRNIPDFETYLDGIEKNHFGGTCYSNNYYINRLLNFLGYDVSLCGAEMNEPDVHLTNIVRVDGREFIVDPGYAAPFLQPLPRDLSDDYVVELGPDRYVLHPQNNDGKSRLDLFRKGERVHGYTQWPNPRTIEHFEKPIAESFIDESQFIKTLLLVRFFPGRSIVIRNLSLIKSHGIEYETEKIQSRKQLPAVIEEHFGIDPVISSQAIADMGNLEE